MTTITIILSDDRLARLRERAARSGMAPEEFLRAQVEQWLERSESDFAQAARYVLDKNAELYRRLA